MLINSNTRTSQKSSLKKELKSESKNKILDKKINNPEKPQIYVSNFQIKPLSKKKVKHSNPRINIIINNNNQINSSISNNPINDEKSIRDYDTNSTFIFTGNNASYLDNNQIIENYLKKPMANPLFDCKSISTISIKEESEFIPIQQNSFTLSSSSSSLPSNTMSTNHYKKNNKKLMSLLKKINTKLSSSESSKIKEEKEKSSNNMCSNTFVKKEKAKKITKEKRNKKKSKKLYLVILILINIFAYICLIVKMFEPSVSDLFFDNDHDGYIYKTSLLSQDRSIVINK